MTRLESNQVPEMQRGYDRWLQRFTTRWLAGRWGVAVMNTCLLWSWRRFGIRDQDRLLDVGCGSGAVLSFLARRVRPAVPWFGVDVSNRFLADARRVVADVGGRHPIVISGGSADNLPFADNSFDVLLSSHVLHHFHADALAGLFAEAHRVLRPGGESYWWAFRQGSTAEDQERNWRILRLAKAPREVMDHLHFHTADDIAERLDQAGLRPRPLALDHFMLPPVGRFSIAASKPHPESPTGPDDLSLENERHRREA